MNTVKHRYSAEIQRTRGLLELAAALYDTSLSFQTEAKAAQHFYLPEAAPFMCVGMMTERLPAKRPSLPPDRSINHLVGIGLDRHGEKATWLLFPTDAELE